MVGRQGQMALAVLDDRDREALGERGERRRPRPRSRPASAVTISGFFAAGEHAAPPRRSRPRRAPAASAATRRAGLS